MRSSGYIKRIFLSNKAKVCYVRIFNGLKIKVTQSSSLLFQVFTAWISIRVIKLQLLLLLNDCEALAKHLGTRDHLNICNIAIN